MCKVCIGIACLGLAFENVERLYVYIYIYTYCRNTSLTNHAANPTLPGRSSTSAVFVCPPCILRRFRWLVLQAEWAQGVDPVPARPCWALSSDIYIHPQLPSLHDAGLECARWEIEIKMLEVRSEIVAFDLLCIDTCRAWVSGGKLGEKSQADSFIALVTIAGSTQCSMTLAAGQRYAGGLSKPENLDWSTLVPWHLPEKNR